jgi:hypothetical protein
MQGFIVKQGICEHAGGNCAYSVAGDASMAATIAAVRVAGLPVVWR